jgi:hypothetical protein
MKQLDGQDGRPFGGGWTFLLAALHSMAFHCTTAQRDLVALCSLPSGQQQHMLVVHPEQCIWCSHCSALHAVESCINCCANFAAESAPE